MSDNGARPAVTPRKIVGFLVAVFGILLGFALSIPGIVLAGAYWNAQETGGWEGRIILILMIVVGFAIGFGIFKLGRRIAG
ncbi:MAG: hypothetical protein KF794_14415 [Xanthobacteraceae bacterium]|nr:hypothetical protein [Xanthobacteraceae bacterium]QYK44928.1 MAG: hypothetical protein KF794_14415 [Xanthobacteraceae bacterium]